ncbi:MAG: D-aminoacyl-tRNA deacylase [bacterium]
MRIIVQRVAKAKVEIEGEITGKIKSGIMLLVGIAETDNEKIMDWIVNKVVNLRIFPDENGVMNKSVKETAGGIMVISNFTLYADATKGFRPSYSHAARPELAEPIFDKLVAKFKQTGIDIAEGKFGAMMDIELVNSGPVTIIVEKENH